MAMGRTDRPQKGGYPHKLGFRLLVLLYKYGNLPGVHHRAWGSSPDLAVQESENPDPKISF